MNPRTSAPITQPTRLSRWNAKLALFVVIILSASSCLAATKPIVLIPLTDDQGYGGSSAHGNPVFNLPFRRSPQFNSMT